MNDPRLVRVSDADRLAVITRLQDATAEGRLTLDELDDRVSGALVARTQIDLDEMVDDLPSEDEVEPEPEPDEEDPAPASVAGPLAVLAVGVIAIPATYFTNWGFVLSLAAVVVGVTLLVTRREMSRAHRVALLAGIALGLVPPAFAVTLYLLLSA
jgi:hypothetical protein